MDCFRKEEPSLIFEILQKLSELKRFDMAVMFMSEPEKKSKSMRKAFPDLYSDMFLHLFNKYSGHLLNTYTKIHIVKFKLITS